MPHEISPHDLKPDELDSLYRTYIAPQLFSGVYPSENPVTVLLGGQPGAGKSSGADTVRNHYPHDSFVELNIDEVRQFHPDYAELLKDDPENMSWHTNQAAKSWIERGEKHAYDHGLSTIAEGTWKTPANIVANASAAKEAKRNTHAVVVAVPPELSCLGALSRFYRQQEKGKNGRWVPVEFHDRAVANLPESVAALGAHPDVDTLTVVNRDGTVLYNSKTPGVQRSRDARAALTTEHKRPLTPQEHDFACKTANYIIAAHRVHTAGKPEAETAHAWATSYLQQLTGSAQAPGTKQAQGQSPAAHATSHNPTGADLLTMMGQGPPNPLKPGQTPRNRRTRRHRHHGPGRGPGTGAGY